MICNTLVANTTGSVPFSMAFVSLSMFAVSADANTSAGAPWVICVTSADEASKLKVTFALGLALVNAAPTALKESVSDVAANTVMLPDTAEVVVVVGAAAVVVGAAVVATVVVAPGPPALSLLSLPQAAATNPNRARGTRRRRGVPFMGRHHSQLLTDTPSGTE
jgi:hypothetical protein